MVRFSGISPIEKQQKSVGSNPRTLDFPHIFACLLYKSKESAVNNLIVQVPEPQFFSLSTSYSECGQSQGQEVVETVKMLQVRT